MSNKEKKYGMKLIIPAQDMDEFEEAAARKSSVIEDLSF